MSCAQSATDNNTIKVGSIALQESPATSRGSEKWSSGAFAKAVPEGPDGKTVLRIEVPKAAGTAADGSVQQDVNGVPIKLSASSYIIERPLDLKDLKGWRVDVTARVRSSQVPPAEVPWEGIRLGLQFETPASNYNAAGYGLPTGEEWHEVAMRNIRIPENATKVTLFTGLIATAGTLWVDDIRIVRTELPLTQLAAQHPPFVQKTQWRGSNGAHPKNGWIPILAKQWNANFLKWWYKLPSPDLPEADYNSELEKGLQGLDSVVDQAEAAGIQIVPQISTVTPDWRSKANGGTDRVYLEPAVAERFVKTWQFIAKRYAGREGIHGYDLMNETQLRTQPAANCPDYEGLMERTALAINAIDPKVRIIVQPEEWWGVNAFNKLRPIKAKNVVYSVHMYTPFELTHQGLRSRKSEGIAYPGVIKGKQWNKETLRQALKPARDFQQAYGVPMQVGEFSCIRWAPDGSRDRWLKDVIDLFEENGWDWMYHGVLDWDGWSVELGEDSTKTTPTGEAAPAKQILFTALARNTPPVPKLTAVQNVAPIPVKDVTPAKAGDVVFEANFEDDAGVKLWQGNSRAKIEEGYKSARSLRLDCDSTSATRAIQVRTPLSIEQLRGSRIKFESMVKGKDVTQPALAYNGVKVLLQVATSKGTQYPQANSTFGTFDWKPMQGTFAVPADATEGWLILGLQDTIGTVWFDDVKITVLGQ